MPFPGIELGSTDHKSSILTTRPCDTSGGLSPSQCVKIGYTYFTRFRFSRKWSSLKKSFSPYFGRKKIPMYCAFPNCGNRFTYIYNKLFSDLGIFQVPKIHL